MRDSQTKGRLRLRHLQEHHEARGEELQEQRQRFQRLAREDSAPRAVSAFNLFQTPQELADRVARMFPRFVRTLEPSAGLGRLYDAVRRRSPDCEIVLVEQAQEFASELYRMTEQDHAARLIVDDFLQCGQDRIGTFDSIIMNPPFKMGRDITHIRHALTLLNDGGTLISLCAAGPKQRSALETQASEWIDLPAGSFKESFTNVAAAIVVFRK